MSELRRTVSVGRPSAGHGSRLASGTRAFLPASKPGFQPGPNRVRSAVGEWRGKWSRGYLPHVDCGPTAQFVTFRLEDSLPSHVYAQWVSELADLSDDRRRIQLARRVDRFLDCGQGTCILRNPVAASIVQEALLFAHERSCQMHAWAVMPNHVHVAMTPHHDKSVGQIIGPLKGFTSREIHKRLGGQGRLWQPESYDVVIRNERHWIRVVRYIEWNPVKARLCTEPAGWPYSTASQSVARRLLGRRTTLSGQECPR